VRQRLAATGKNIQQPGTAKPSDGGADRLL
jgi:hypothetical protein